MDLSTVIYLLIFWFFLGWLVDMMIKEEEENRIKYDTPERDKLN
jgi:hypothetical protein